MFKKVHREWLGFCWASCFPCFRNSLSILAAGERAVAFKSLHPLREAGTGGQDFQETFLQAGSEESLGAPHATLPGPLLQCCPGETHLGSVGNAVHTRNMCFEAAAPASWGVPHHPQSSQDPRGHHLLVLPTRLREGPVKTAHILAD